MSPPIAYHDGLPAWTPQGRAHEFRIGAHRMFFSDDSIRKSMGSGEWYLAPGWRTGAAAGSWTAEYGAQALAEFRPSEFNLVGAFSAGIARTNPSIALRLAWYALWLGYIPSEGRAYPGLTPYYQISLLAGNDHKPSGLHGAAGVRMGPLAVGPMLVGEYSHGQAALRAEASLMFPPPMFYPPVWWAGPKGVRGNTFTFGLTIAAATRAKRQPQ
jgi:hypothetical protein